MNPEIIIMLTNNDITVTNAEEVFESCKDLPAKKWGFKDIGLPKEEMIQLAKKMKDVFGCDGVNIVQNNGVAAGQTVFHFHIHLIPRYEGDHAGVTWKPGTLTDEEREEILQKWK